ncbi:MAG TPA: ComF family protein [Candidatus Kapabacteria bacterium]|nr:ComF family protein [Candidatus Kapabacteria bacterium]
MVNIKPSRLPGRWREGFALDYHTISSTYLGDDEFGHSIFDTRRTELGELLYRLKYRSDSSVINEIALILATFINSWNPGVDIIIPVPPTRSARSFQPVLTLAEALSGKLNIPNVIDAVAMVEDIPELKNVYDYDERLRLLQGVHVIQSSIVKGRRILLFDDLYRSGATMNTITAELYDHGLAADVFALAITRTRSKS